MSWVVLFFWGREEGGQIFVGFPKGTLHQSSKVVLALGFLVLFAPLAYT